MIAVLRVHGLCGGRLFQRIDADEFSRAAFVFKLHYAVKQREECIVLASADVLPGFPFGASLPRNNIAASNAFAAKLLKAQSLRI